MSFLQPLALLGLLALPIILILHLLRERSRRAVVPSLELWRWLEKEVRGPRFKRIPVSWILILQLLAAALLTLALLQPQLAALGASARGQRLILVLDTSGSMSAQDAAPTRLAQAQARAAGLLGQLRGRDSAVIISAGPTARVLAESGADGMPAVASALAAAPATGVGTDWEGALALAAAAISDEQANRVVVFTDGAYTWPAHLDQLRLPARVEWYTVGGPQGNQAVLGLSARPAASGAVQVFAQVANFGNSPARREITLRADGRIVDQTVVDLAPSGLLAHAWSLPPGTSSVEVRLSGGDTLPADDAAWLGIANSLPRDVLLVSDAPALLERALRSLPNVQLRTASPANYRPFDRRDLTVFDGWLPDAWPAGAVLVVAPPAGSPLLPVTGAQAVRALAYSPDPLLADVDLESAGFNTTSRLGDADWLAPVLTDAGGAGLIWRGATNSSRVIVVGLHLADSSIARRPALPVLMANIVAELLPAPLTASVAPGAPLVLPSAQLFPTVRITAPDGQVHTLGPDRGAAFDDTAQPGLYRLESQADDGQPWQAAVGVNAGDAHESDLRVSTRPAFAQSGAPVDFAGQAQPFKLWPLAVLLALAALAYEARLAWR